MPNQPDLQQPQAQHSGPGFILQTSTQIPDQAQEGPAVHVLHALLAQQERSCSLQLFQSRLHLCMQPPGCTYSSRYHLCLGF